VPTELAAPHRLPTTVRPSRYELRIEVDLHHARFWGSVAIDLDITEPVETIECHALDLEIHAATLDGRPVADHRLESDSQRLILSLSEPRTPGPAHLVVEFSGLLNDKLVGFYRSTYTDEAGTHTLAVTQFQAPHARRCFPCWDEPDAKATFQVSLVVGPDDLAISNTAEIGRQPTSDGRVLVRFAETIPISTYLVAFVVGRLEASDPVDVDGVPVRVIHRPGQGHRCGEALAVATHALRWFTSYYGIPYPGDKLDLVAVPDFAFGAMENLGCITFREVLLLLDPDELTRPELERAVTVIAHEIAHMWFGDLVTMSWWDGIWLNEAFATFMELCCTDAYRPDWRVWDRFGPGRSSALETDALPSTRPIHFEVATPEDAEAMFDVITYEKGCAILRMVEQYLGPEGFRAGVRRYLERHQFGNTEIGDLWQALGSVTDQPVVEVMESWIHQGGHPLVTATPGDGTIRLEQMRFAYDGAGSVPESTWLVPLRVRAGRADGSSIEQRVLLTDRSLDLPPDGALLQASSTSWLLLNSEATGFFRSRVQIGAEPPREALSAAERYGQLDDRWALVLAGLCPLRSVVETLRTLDERDDVETWRRGSAILWQLRRLGGVEHGPAVARLALDLTSDTDPDDWETRGVVVSIRGGLGADPELLAQCRQWLSERAPHPELTAAAIEVVAQHGTAEEYERFVHSFRNADSPQEEQRYLTALTRFGDPALFDRTLSLCRTEVRTQNAPYAIASALAHPTNGARAWGFVRDHWNELEGRFPSNSIVRMVGGVRHLFDPTAAAEVLDFFAGHPIPQAGRSLSQHLDMVRVHQHLRRREYAELSRTLSP
jgi:puromycin-sensitive aminopeptidase